MIRLARWMARVVDSRVPGRACGLVSGLAVAVLATAAQAEVKVGLSYVEMGDWRYTPIVDTNRGGEPIAGFVGLLNPAVSVGNNITAIWYSRNASGAWSNKAWVAEDGWKVIESVKAEAGISSNYDHDWAAWGPKSQAAVPSTQVAALYNKGFLVGDPVGDLARESGQADAIVEFLKDIGYPVADVKFEKTDPNGCNQVYVLNWMSTVATVAESSTATDAQFASAFYGYLCDISWFWPHWTRETVPPPLWGPPPGPPPALGPGWSPPLRDPNGSTSFYCTYTATVTHTRTRTRVRWFPWIGTATCVETQTETCTYSVSCLKDASGPGGGCPAQPGCATTPTVSCDGGGEWSSCW